LSDPQLKRLSKLLSGLLRHFPEAVGIRPDDGGWIDIEMLVEAIKTKWKNKELYQWVEPRHIYEIALNDEKGRFEVRNGKIRARYGHSYKVKIDYPGDRDVKFLYHGTTSRSLKNILKEGLKPMKRLWVHLSPTLMDAYTIALRRTGRPIILKVDAQRLREYTPVYKASNRVYLVKYVPPDCIVEVI